MRCLATTFGIALSFLGSLQANAQPASTLAVSLARGWEDHRTRDLVEALRTGAPAANVTIVPVDQAGSVPVVLGIPQPYRRFHFFIPVDQPSHHRDRSTHFAGFLLRCDVRREDLCANHLLARLDQHFRGRS